MEHTDSYNQLILLLRTLRGAPLACLFALETVRIPMSLDLLSQILGYNMEETEDALELLRNMGSIVQGPDKKWVVNHHYSPEDYPVITSTISRN